MYYSAAGFSGALILSIPKQEKVKGSSRDSEESCFAPSTLLLLEETRCGACTGTKGTLLGKLRSVKVRGERDIPMPNAETPTITSATPRLEASVLRSVCQSV